MKRILLTRGKYALVDDEDYEWLNQWKWCAVVSCRGIWYAERGTHRNYTPRSIKMHRVIMGCSHGDGKAIDHIDHNGLNNCRNNLRICTVSQNLQNSRPRKDGSSIYKGVSWLKRDRRWLSHIWMNGKQKYIGSFTDEIKAAKAYDEAAKYYFGEFACPNFNIDQEKVRAEFEREFMITTLIAGEK